jgi:hypothetical protein
MHLITCLPHVRHSNVAHFALFYALTFLYDCVAFRMPIEIVLSQERSLRSHPCNNCVSTRCRTSIPCASISFLPMQIFWV